MKKVIWILGVVMIAITVFFTANAVSSPNSDTNLASLLTLNTANAQGETGGTNTFKKVYPKCIFKLTGSYGYVVKFNNVSYTIPIEGYVMVELTGFAVDCQINGQSIDCKSITCLSVYNSLRG